MRRLDRLPRRAALGMLALLAAGCDGSSTDATPLVRTEVRVSLAAFDEAPRSGRPRATVLDTVAVVVAPAVGGSDTVRGTFDDRGEVSLSISVQPGTVRFSAFVVSNNGTRVYSSAQRVREIRFDGFLVELELEVEDGVPIPLVDPDSVGIDALTPATVRLLNVGSASMSWSADVMTLVPCNGPTCVVVEPSSGTLEADDAVELTVRAVSPGGGLFQIAVATSSGTLPLVVSVTESLLPGAPDLAGVATPGSIELTWSDPNDVEDLLRLERGTDGVNWTEIALLPAGTVAYSDLGIQSATTYHYRVRACAGAVCSPFSNAVAVRTSDPGALRTPTLFAIPVDDTRIDLTWSDNSTSESEFVLERSTDEGATWSIVVALAPNTNAFSDRGLAAGRYRYRIRACNPEACSPYSNEAFASLPLDPGTPVPAAPSDATAILGPSEDFIRLTWTDNSGTEQEFQIERSTDGIEWELRALVGPSTVAFVDGRVKGPQTYMYRIRACNAGGCSTFSNVASAFVP